MVCTLCILFVSWPLAIVVTRQLQKCYLPDIIKSAFTVGKVTVVTFRFFKTEYIHQQIGCQIYRKMRREIGWVISYDNVAESKQPSSECTFGCYPQTCSAQVVPDLIWFCDVLVRTYTCGSLVRYFILYLKQLYVKSLYQMTVLF